MTARLFGAILLKMKNEEGEDGKLGAVCNECGTRYIVNGNVQAL